MLSPTAMPPWAPQSNPGPVDLGPFARNRAARRQRQRVHVHTRTTCPTEHPGSLAWVLFTARKAARRAANRRARASRQANR